MALDFNALKGLQENLNKGGTGGKFLFAKEIGEATDVRLLPPPPSMNGLYFLEVHVWWVNGKKLYSPATLGEECPIELEVDKARALKDPELDALINENPKLSKKVEYWIPVLHLDVNFDDRGNPVKVKIDTGKPKILICGRMLLKSINKIVTSRNYQNGTPDGLMDRMKGYNIILSKTGEKLNTEYSAEGWLQPMEMDEKFYENPLNMIEEVKKEMNSNAYLVGVVRNYLYGENMPKEEKASEPKESNTPRKAAPARPTRKPAPYPEPEEEYYEYEEEYEEQEEEPKPVKRAPAKKPVAAKKEEAPAKKPAGRSLLADLDNLD